MCSQNFYADVARQLLAYGYELPVLYLSQHCDVKEFKKASPRSAIAVNFDLMSGDVPVGLDVEPDSVSEALICQLSAFEGAALQLLDRRNFDGRSVQDLRSLYLKYISLWNGILSSYLPDVVVLHVAPHQGHDFVLYHLCRARNIPVLIIDRTYINERMYIRCGLECGVQVPADLIGQEVIRVAQSTVGEHASTSNEKLNQEINNFESIRRELRLPALIRLIVSRELFRSHWKRVTNTVHGVSQRRPLGITLRFQELCGRIGIRRAMNFYESVCKRPDLTQPYVYFALHYQPERTTVPDGGFLSDQLNLVAMVSRSLPRGWMLFVKEHPRQFRRGLTWHKGRNIEFYSQLLRLPSVQLVPLDVSSEQLIQNCRVAATVTGTTGWEAVQIGRPALVFGYPWYINCPGVHRITNADECRTFLDQVANNLVTIRDQDTKAYLQLLDKFTFRACPSLYALSKSKMTLSENSNAYALAIHSAIRTKVWCVAKNT